MEIKFLDDSIDNFIESLEPQAIAKVLRTLDLLEKFGSHLGMPHSKKIYDKVFGLRIVGKQNIRLLYAFHKSEAIVLHAFVKKSKKAPKKEIEVALAKYKNLI